jgi:hypothetical protein
MMPGAEWLAMLCGHIADRYEHLVRYAGWYSKSGAGRADEEGARKHGGRARRAPALA